MDSDTVRHLKRIVTDLLILLTVSVPILLFKIFGEPYKRGFFCDDTSIRYPYKESTVTNVMLYIIGLGLPIVTMILLECLNSIKYGNSETIPIKMYGKIIPVWIIESYKHIGYFGFGAALSQLTTDFGKYTIGRLRPHFMQVCNPAINCSSVYNEFMYISDFTCNASNMKLLKDARLSFPSGHSSFSAYTMFYLIIYLQYKMQFRNSSVSDLIRPFLQFVCGSLAWCTALSRVSNYKHHWSDVLVGMLIGTIFAILNAKYISKVFQNSPRMNNTSLMNRRNVSNLENSQQSITPKSDVAV